MTKVKQITRIAYKVPPTGFSTFDVEYYLSTSTTTLAGGSWQTTPPEWIEGRYMWTRTKVVKTDGTTTYSDPVCIGGTGRGIRSIQEQYYLSTSNTEQTGGSWANNPQTWVDGKYMWTRSVITYTDGTTVTTDPVCVTGGKGATGQSVFKSIVFRRVNASSVNAPTGGSYASPVPTTTGWSDGIPSGTAQLWMSTRIFTSDGQAPQQSAWTTPQPATDTAGIDFEYSAVESNPGTPTTSPNNWHDTPTSSDIWMAMRTSSNGVWGSWEVFKIKGEKGDTGQSAFKSIVFRRVNASSVNAPTGGSYASPVPTTTGWSDGIPSGTAQLWMSTRIFTSDGQAPQQSAWTTPQPATDTAGIDFEYSAVESNPGTPTTSPNNWHDTPTSSDIWMAMRTSSNGVWGSWEVFKVKGEKGDPGTPGETGPEGKSFVPVYKNWDTKPATPTGSTMPPSGWRANVDNQISGLAVSAYDTSVIPVSEQLRDGGGNLVVGTQDCEPISFTLGQENVEYGVPYFVLPGYEVDANDSVSHIDYGCAIARIDFTTASANQQIRVELLASSEATYDCIMLGKLDSTRIPDRNTATSYSGKASGPNVKVAVDLMIPTAGAHFIYVVYRKDSSASSYADRGCFRVADLSETLWMSIATMRGESVLSWSAPIKMTAGRGERGAVPRMRNFAEGILFMEGKAGEAYLDFAFHNNRFYRCTKTHVSQVGETPYDEVQNSTGFWALENDYQFIASKVVWVGTGAQGWLIDAGRIYHSSGLIELNADGSIQTSNGKFKVTKEGVVKATDGEFSGKVTASTGQIAGFKISGNGLTNDPFTNDAYVIFRNDSQGAFAGIGGNVLPASSGARAVGRFENHDNDDLWGLGVNYGILVSARNAGENRAIQIDGGCLTGLALRNTIIGNSVTSKTLGRYDCHVICINSNDCTITLPTMQLYDSGHVIKVKWLGGKVKFNVSYCYTPNGTSYRYTRPCIIYGSNDTIAPGNTLDYSNAGCGCDFIWVPELTRTIGNDTYYGAWIQYMHPRTW